MNKCITLDLTNVFKTFSGELQIGSCILREVFNTTNSFDNFPNSSISS